VLSGPSDNGDLMGKEKSGTASSILRELFQTGVYKRAQGRVARQVTFAALAVSILFGAWQLFYYLVTWPDAYRYGITGMVLVTFLWLSYRLVNYPRFADFLVAVEAEMSKVSWPTRTELWRSSLVVIIVIFVLAAVLFLYDVVWVQIFRKLLGILA
jgi:preprotein translocase subunit SecE